MKREVVEEACINYCVKHFVGTNTRKTNQHCALWSLQIRLKVFETSENFCVLKKITTILSDVGIYRKSSRSNDHYTNSIMTYVAY